ncbi:MAG: FAD-dependent oxidoreductase [SAR324 cluster bacterium]|nr:FAD-dependent oxidoreductase [SAR324 cluster bacterium]
MSELRDIIVVGAGPAGLSAALTASGLGLDVLVLDEQPALGGQLYRNIEKANEQTLKILGSDYGRGRHLIEKFRNSNAEHLAGATVWNIEANGNVYYSKAGQSSEIRGKHVILAIGAAERSVPFPGWTLPGVMGAGAVDSNFKSSGTIPEGPVVFAGSGPLFLSTLGHMTSLGVEIGAVLDTTPQGNLLAALPFLPRAMKRLDYFLKGAGMLLNLRRLGIKYAKGINGYEAHGRDRVEKVSYSSKNGVQHVEAGVFLVHEGLVPRCDFTQLLGLKHCWDAAQRYWYPQINHVGATEIDTIYVVGDGAFVHGGMPAITKGSLAAVDIAGKLNALPLDSKTVTLAKLEKKLSSELDFRPFVDVLFRPRSNLFKMSDQTLVCRCEEVTAGEIRRAINEGCLDSNETKAITRCGMGRCQGRMCGSALNEIIIDELNRQPLDTQPLRMRPPVRNISLAELSQLSLFKNRVR